MLSQSLVFVDLETTGGNPVSDRIMEIGIVKVVAGRVDYEWQTLINPEAPIPPAIQGFTGITDDMVRDAPTFEQVAEEVFDRLQAALFVAHNARFDYGFLRNAFARLEIPFQRQVLCTVKLSRALYPEHHRHGLDALIARHGLNCSARHRALGDARALWDFIECVRREKTDQDIQVALAKAMKKPSLPNGLEAHAIDAVPEGPGVYLFYGENDVPLYVGKSTGMRSRVQSHFAADPSAGRARRMVQEVRRIDWVETAGELGALLKETQLIRAKSPVHNRHFPCQGELSSYRLHPPGAGGAALELVRTGEMTPDEVPSLYGLFKTKREATTALRELAGAHQLCPKRLGLESGGGPCGAHHSRRCRGVCAGRETAEQHDLRLYTALLTLKLRAWPYGGRVAIREHDPVARLTEYHVFESWCYLGTARDEEGLRDAAARSAEALFDVETYRMLTRYLSRHRPEVVHLARQPGAMLEA